MLLAQHVYQQCKSYGMALKGLRQSAASVELAASLHGGAMAADIRTRYQAGQCRCSTW